jgi:hypothetical protein
MGVLASVVRITRAPSTLDEGDSVLILWVLVYVDDCIIVDNSEDLRSRFVTDLGKRFPVDDRGELEWMLGLAVRRDRASRVLTLSQELYIKDLVDRYASYISAGHNRKYDTPVEEGLRLSHDDCPTPGSADGWKGRQPAVRGQPAVRARGRSAGRPCS